MRCFNPTLVRLRQDHAVRTAITRLVFQSHAGSIEAQMGRRLGFWCCGVSIPRWFD